MQCLYRLRISKTIERVAISKFNGTNYHILFNVLNKHILMRIVEDKDGERFLVIENDEDFEKFKEDLLKLAREKANAHKPSYETQSPK